jgi:NAD(P)H dehydrogenase (quinone)
VFGSQSDSGVPTRYGNFPAQWKAFWDATGGLWGKQALAGKMFGTFVSTGTPGGGQELTAFQSLSVAIHHGMVYIPIGYQIPELVNLDEVHGGSPWGYIHISVQRLIEAGAGTFAGPDGSRRPTPLELTIARTQGKIFANYVQKH